MTSLYFFFWGAFSDVEAEAESTPSICFDIPDRSPAFDLVRAPRFDLPERQPRFDLRKR